jgi:signal transduction histidine kinase
VIDANGRPIIGRDGRAVRDVALHAERAPIWLRVFDLIESGRTCGEVRATLHSEGIRKQRGAPWRTRDIRRGILDPWYAGRARSRKYDAVIEDDHEPLIEPARWERIAELVRTDERAPKGGRPPMAEADNYLLRGVATSMRCDASLYTRRLASGRHYICRSVRESTGCDANYIPAEAVEQAVLNHLDSFVADVRAWLEQRTAQSADERDRFAEMVGGQRTELRKLDRRAARARALADQLLDQGDDQTAALALRKAAEVEAEQEQLAAAIADAEQRMADWPKPDVDEALDVYQQLRDAVAGRMDGCQSLQDTRATLRSVLEAARLDYRDGEVFGAFYPRATDAGATGRLPFEVDLSTGTLGTIAGVRADGSNTPRTEETPTFTRTLDAKGEEWLRSIRSTLEEPDTTCS